jgi:HAMP domain-containing protein
MGTEAIIELVALILGCFGTFFARWRQTNRELTPLERAARVLDATQIFDSTRRLDDP